MRHDAATPLHFRNDQIGRLSTIEAVRPLVANSPERQRQLRQGEGLTDVRDASLR